MVYDSNTREVLHPLTSYGKDVYADMLCKEADRILVDSKHNVLATLVRLFEKLGMSDTLVQNRYNKLLNDMKEDRQ